jgi:hypothetical protein
MYFDAANGLTALDIQNGSKFAHMAGPSSSQRAEMKKVYPYWGF